jgi:hypothetical protein
MVIGCKYSTLMSIHGSFPRNQDKVTYQSLFVSGCSYLRSGKLATLVGKHLAPDRAGRNHFKSWMLEKMAHHVEPHIVSPKQVGSHALWSFSHVESAKSSHLLVLPSLMRDPSGSTQLTKGSRFEKGSIAYSLQP